MNISLGVFLRALVVLSLSATLARADTLVTLDNGLRVALQQRAQESLVRIHVYYGVGHGDDPEGKEGLAHLVEHLMFTSAGSFEDGGLRRALALNAASYGATTMPVQIEFHEACLPALAPELLDLEAARMRSFAPSAAEFEREKSILQQELAFRQHGGSFDNLFYAMLRASFEGHPMGRLSTPESIDSLRLEDAEQFHRRFIVPWNAVLVVRGSIDEKQMLAKIGRSFDSIPGPSSEDAELARPNPPSPRSAGVVVDDYEYEGFLLGIGYALPYREPLDVARAHFFRAFLEFGQVDPFFWVIGEEVLIVRVSSWSYYVNPELGYDQVRPEENAQWVLDYVLDRLERERTLIGRRGRFEPMRQALLARLKRQFDEPGSAMDRIGGSLLAGREPPVLEELVSTIDGLTLPEVQEFLQQTLRSDALITGVLHGRNSGRDVDALLLGTAGDGEHAVLTADPLAGLEELAIEHVLEAYAEAALTEIEQVSLRNGVPLNYLCLPRAPALQVGGVTSFAYLMDERPGKKAGITTIYEWLVEDGYRESGSSGDPDREPNPLPFGMTIRAGPCEFEYEATGDEAEAESILTALRERFESKSFNLSTWRGLLHVGESALGRLHNRPEGKTHRFLREQQYGAGHAFLNKNLGEPETIAKLKYKHMEELHDKLTRTGHSEIYAVGPLEVEQLRSLADEYLTTRGRFRKMRPGELPSPLTQITGEIFPAFERRETSLFVAFSPQQVGPTSIRWSEMKLFLQTLDIWLSRELRHERGLVYLVVPSDELALLCVGLSIRTSSIPELALDVYRQLHQSLQEIDTAGFSEAAVLRGKLRLVGNLTTALDEPSAAFALLRDMSRFHDVVEDPVEEILQISTQRLNEVRSELLDSHAYAFAVVGPILEEDIELFHDARRQAQEGSNDVAGADH